MGTGLNNWMIVLNFCVACGDSNPSHLQQHHLVPRSCGGSNDPINKITLCCVCHGKWHAVEWDNSHKALIAAGINRARAKGTRSGKPIGRPAIRPRSKTLSVRLTRPGERPCAVLPSDSMSVLRLYGASRLRFEGLRGRHHKADAGEHLSEASNILAIIKKALPLRG